MNQEEKAKSLFDDFWQGLKNLFVGRRIVDVESWDGSPSRWPSTESYCNSSLINLNEGPPEDWTQANCKLPVRNPGQSQDTYVRQAVFAAAARFNQVEAPPEAKEEARRELLRAYEEMGQEPPEVLTRAVSGERLMNALHQKMYQLDREITDSDHYFVDMYYDNGGLYALYTDQGRLYRYPVIVQNDDVMLGERLQVMEVHQPVQTRTIVRQQDDGKYRWFSVSGTAVLNRSGEIDSRALFDSFVQHAEETGEYPIRQFYHQGKAFRTGQADYLARDGYCYITSGLYDDTPLAKAEITARQREPDYWGDSIGFFSLDAELTEIGNGIRIPAHQRGINKEISTLPESEAAHLFTRTEVQMALEGREWEAFLRLWDGDEEKARQWLDSNPDARNRAIEENGMITRETDTEGDEKNPEIVIDESVINEVSRSVLESEVIQDLSSTLEELKTQLGERVNEVKELTRTVDDLNKRLAKLENEKSALEQQLENDTPAKFKEKTRVVYRPRVANASLIEDGTPYNEKAVNNLKGVSY